MAPTREPDSIEDPYERIHAVPGRSPICAQAPELLIGAFPVTSLTGRWQCLRGRDREAPLGGYRRWTRMRPMMHDDGRASLGMRDGLVCDCGWREGSDGAHGR